MNFKEFVTDAVKHYNALPQETNALYRRHHFSMPMEEEATVKRASRFRIARGMPQGMAKDFDAVIDSQGHAAGGDGFVTVKDAAELDDSYFDSAMHKSSEDKYVAYFNAHMRKVVFVDIPYGMKARVNLRFVESGAPLFAKILVSLKSGASLELTERYESSATGSMLGAMHEVVLGSASSAEINVLHDEGERTPVLCFLKDTLGEGAKLRVNSIYSGGAIARSRSEARASSRKSAVEVNEIILGSSAQKFDMHTRIVNSAQDTEAMLESRAVLEGSSACILKGFAKVEEGASKSRSRIRERGILLDGSAAMDALPGMSVDEKDVQVAHSSATAPADAETMFYLASRGLSDSEARKLVVTGFLNGGVEKIGSAYAKQAAAEMIDRKFEAKRR